MWDGVNRRSFPRAEYPCLIKIKLCKKAPSSEPILTHTENISVSGVRVIIRRKLEPTTEVDLEMDLMDTFLTVASEGIVRWVKEVPFGKKGQPVRYDTGIQFIGLKEEYRKRIHNIVSHVNKSK